MALMARITLVLASLVALAIASPCCELRKKGLPVVNPTPSPNASAAPSDSNSTATPKRSGKFSYGSEMVRGVNLGGWLVLEPWITPSIFDNTGNDAIVDEWTFGEYQDYNTALGTLQDHWSSWITETDFADIKAAGLNHVRIPIGFWAFDNTATPYIKGNQYHYLKQAVQWANKYGISVLVDLHGVPGSQNGYDNSGQRGTPEWQTSESNVQESLAIISTLAGEFSKSEYGGTVTAIELINEPAGYLNSAILDTAQQYYSSGYSVVRKSSDNIVVVLHDAFQALSFWDGVLTPDTGAFNVMMDTHIYQVFNDAQLEETWPEHIQDACSNGPRLSSYASQNLWTIVGEWTTAPTDCATYLNGLGVGSRYDGTFGDGNPAIGNCAGMTGDASTFDSDYITFLGQFWQAQVTAYEQAQGWIYWCWKNEQADDWSYSKGLAWGWIPQDPTDRPYGNLCN